MSAVLQQRLDEMGPERAGQLVEDLCRLLREEWGRRLFYGLVFGLGKLHGPSYDPAIKYGAELAPMHSEGWRDLAGSLYDLAQDAAPLECLDMMEERVNARRAEIVQALKVKASAGDKQ
jgi:hypothetical protein